MYEWYVRFEVNPPLLKTESINKYEFKLENQKTFVDYFYKTSKITKQLKNKHGEFEYAEKTIAHKHQLKIKKLMIQRIINLKISKPIEIKIVDGFPKLLNEYELKKEGLPTSHPVVIILNDSHSTYNVDDSLKEAQKFWNSGLKFNYKGKKKGDIEEDIFRLADWIILAEKQNDEIKSFILTWIAFNGLYNLFCSITAKQKMNDAEKIDYVIGELLKYPTEKEDTENAARKIVDTYSNLFDQLETFNILSESKITNYSTELTKLRKSSLEIEIVKCAAKCIYGVRKEVFHEAPSMEIKTDHRCKISKHLLSTITMHCLKNFVNYENYDNN